MAEIKKCYAKFGELSVSNKTETEPVIAFFSFSTNLFYVDTGKVHHRNRVYAATLTIKVCHIVLGTGCSRWRRL